MREKEEKKEKEEEKKKKKKKKKMPRGFFFFFSLRNFFPSSPSSLPNSERGTMSSQRGNSSKTGAQKHQNSFAYKHNPKSKKTEVILSMPIQGLCQHCFSVLEWRKQYRKYKPLTVPKKWFGAQSFVPTKGED